MPAAGIGNLDLHHGNRAVSADDVAGHAHAHRQSSTVGAHGVRSVGAQVHENLVQLARFAHHRKQALSHLEIHADGGREGGAKQFPGFVDDLLDMDRKQFRFLLATEQQNLSSQIAGATATLQDALDRFQAGTLGETDLQQLGVSPDGSEDVVDVVGDATARVPTASSFWL
jgi:hypothetical protein